MEVEVKEGRIGIRKKLRRKRRKLLISELMHDFAKNTTLHGLRYITDRGISFVEKLFWIATFLISLSLCLYLIHNVWLKWQTSPVIVVLSEQLVSAQEVPFPAVTICPQIKVKRSVYNFSAETIYIKKKMADISNWTEKTQAEADRFEDVGILCWSEEVMKNHPKRNYSDHQIVDHLIEVAPSAWDIFFVCTRYTDTVDCKKIFKPVLTLEGVCFTSNSLAADEIFRKKNIQRDYNYLNTTEPSKGWSPTEGYTTPDLAVYPRRGRENGVDVDLRVMLKENYTDRDALCNGVNHGYRIYLQHPADVPQRSLYYYTARPQYTTSLALKISIMNTSTSLVNYPPETRQCYFPEERHLRYFKIYTTNNCRLECLSNYTYSQCGCVWFHMPHHSSSAICRRGKKTCVEAAIERYAFEQGNPDSGANNGGCSCLPSCVGIKYDAEILNTKFDVSTYLNAVKEIFPEVYNPKETDVHITQIELYYKEPRFVSMRRSELFGLTDFLANCGGLLGLFLGFSILSLVEIIYFLTLRLGFTLRTDRLENENK